MTQRGVLGQENRERDRAVYRGGAQFRELDLFRVELFQVLK